VAKSVVGAPNQLLRP